MKNAMKTGSKIRSRIQIAALEFPNPRLHSALLLFSFLIFLFLLLFLCPPANGHAKRHCRTRLNVAIAPGRRQLPPGHGDRHRHPLPPIPHDPGPGFF